MIPNGLPWKWTEIILSFLRLHPSTAFRTLVDYEGYCISSEGFLPTVVDVMVIELNFPILVHFSSLIPKMLMFSSCHLHFQFTLIHGPNLPGSYAMLFFTTSDFTSITSHIHIGVVFTLAQPLAFLLELFLCSSPVAYWSPTNLGSSSFNVISFFLFILFMRFSRQECWSGLPFPSLWTTGVLSELW